MCSKCQIEEGKCEKFITRENPKPYRQGSYLVHGVISCKNCKAVWNRDVNGATNICRIAKLAIQKQPRPEYLSRKKNIDTLRLNLKKRIFKLCEKMSNIKTQLQVLG